MEVLSSIRQRIILKTKKSMKLLYINDYANDYLYVNKCEEREYPSQHLWGGHGTFTPF